MQMPFFASPDSLGRSTFLWIRVKAWSTVGAHQTEALMKIGVPREIKTHEYRVGMTPHSVKAYVKNGHTVLIEKGAGVGSGYEDAEYKTAGAVIVGDKAELFRDAEMIVKVKEPLEEEFPLFKQGQILYT